MEVFYGKQRILECSQSMKYEELCKFIGDFMSIDPNDFYMLSNGKRLNPDSTVSRQIHIVLRTRGGKGGFGSMLRAIGAQIEKTTNREACRDLSGRRLRDINEEQRLKKWVEQQPQREKEAHERKIKKLEKMIEEPKFEFHDEEYEKQRSALPDMVENAVAEGLKVAAAKRKVEEELKMAPKTKKRKLLFGFDSDLSDVDSDSDCDEPTRQPPSPHEVTESEKVAVNN